MNKYSVLSDTNSNIIISCFEKIWRLFIINILKYIPNKKIVTLYWAYILPMKTVNNFENKKKWNPNVNLGIELFVVQFSEKNEL